MVSGEKDPKTFECSTLCGRSFDIALETDGQASFQLRYQLEFQLSLLIDLALDALVVLLLMSL